MTPLDTPSHTKSQTGCGCGKIRVFLDAEGNVKPPVVAAAPGHHRAKMWYDYVTLNAPDDSTDAAGYVNHDQY